MTSEKIGGVTISRLNAERAWDHATVELYTLIGDRPKGKVTHYVVYDVDVIHKDANGNDIRDVNGNLMYKHRKGDKVLDHDGKPIIVPHDVDYVYCGKSPTDRPDDNGVEFIVKDKCMVNINDLGYFTDEALDEVWLKVVEEKRRRVLAKAATDLKACASL